MIIQVELLTGEAKEKRRIRALIDSGAEANCIKRTLALELDLPVLPGRPTVLASPEGKRIYSYANHVTTLSAVDTQGERRGHKVELVSCEFEMPGVDIILGYPWLSKVDPAISFGKATSGRRLSARDMAILNTV
jgi:hypothetical protein